MCTVYLNKCRRLLTDTCRIVRRTFPFEDISKLPYFLETAPLPPDRRVTFRSTDNIEVPDATLLAFHLAIANILHATGMGKKLSDP